MNYINKLTEISNQSKYTKWCISIIQRAQSRSRLDGYTERHHIIPKSFGIGGERDSENICVLTAREHFIVHRCMCKMFTGKYSQKMNYAMQRLCTKSSVQTGRTHSRMYSVVKIKYNLCKRVRLYKLEECRHVYETDVDVINSLLTGGWSTTMTECFKVGRVGNMVGKTHSVNTKRKIGEAHRGKPKPPLSAAHRQSLIDNNTGLVRTTETRHRLSNAMKIQHASGARSSVGSNNPCFGMKRAHCYNPITLERRTIDITESPVLLDQLLSNGWKRGLLRNRPIPSNDPVLHETRPNDIT